jgi:outer membrane protein assembly factor BamC
MNFPKSAFPHKTVALSVAFALIAGCSILPDSKKVDYKSASTGKLPTLEVPPDLTQPSRDERYAVPDIAPKSSATYSAYAGERGGKVAVVASSQEVLPDVGKMRIERAGTQRWLVVPGTPEKLWPTLREFWQENGFIINIEATDTGILETDWAENRAKLPQDFIRSTVGKMFDSLYSTSERDKFRTRLERGAQPGTVEIYLSHRGMVEVYINEGKDATRWQPRQPDPELEAEMLRKLMMRLGADESRAKTQVAGAPQADRAKLNRAPTGIDVLNLDESFDRAWRRVGLALDRTGFTVEDRDRSQGLYFVRYMDPDNEMKPKESGGFLSKLMFWRDDDAKKVATPGDRFRIYVKDGASATSVQVLTREGGVDSSETGRKILGLLQEQLR